MRIADIIEATLKRGMAKYKAAERGGEVTDWEALIRKWDAETKFALAYTHMIEAKPGESLNFPLHLLELSAEADFMLAQFVFGNCYEVGQGVSCDIEKAKYWWKKAAAQGLDDAVERLKEHGVDNADIEIKPVVTPPPPQTPPIQHKKKKPIGVAVILVTLVLVIMATAFLAGWVFGSQTNGTDESSISRLWSTILPTPDVPVSPPPQTSPSSESSITGAPTPVPPNSIETHHASNHVSPEPQGQNREVWKQLYIDFINENLDSFEWATFSLVYLNDDNIPELWVDTGIGPLGPFLCTVTDNELDYWWEGWHTNLSYIERENVFVISTSHSSIYLETDEVYAIQDGKFVLLHFGYYGIEDYQQAIMPDAEDLVTYFWDNIEVTELEYQNLLSTAFDSSRARSDFGTYKYDEFILILDGIDGS